MSSEVVRELFRNLENTLHDRLKVIEDILSSTKQSVSTNTFDASEINDRLSVLEGHFKNLDEYTMGQVRTLVFNHDQLEKRVESLEKSMKSAVESFQTINETVESLQTRLEEYEKKQEDNDVAVEAAEVEAEMEEAQDAEAEEEVEEDEELELEEFEYKKKVYHRDQHNNVYIADEEGCIDPNEVVGIWNPQTKKIDRVSSS